MSNQINQDVIKAREVVASYKELNKGTVEVLSRYDPIRKCRYFEKVQIDPNSKDFIKLYGKKKNEKEKPGKPIKVVEAKTPKPKPKVISKPKKPRYVKVTERKKRGFNENSRASLIYQMHLDGKSNKEISIHFDTPQHYVTAQILTRKKALGLPTAKRKKINSEEVLKEFKNGKTILQLCSIFNVSDAYIYGVLRAEKTDELRALEREDVLRIIKAKCKLNQSNFIFGKMITPAKCKYNYAISIMDVYKYCNELAQQGNIIIPDEKLMKHKGRKICLTIA